MNQFKTKRYSSQPKIYTDEDIDDILHNANIEKTFGTCTLTQCQVCHKEFLGYSQHCSSCRAFFRQVIQRNQKLVCKSNTKDCLIDYSAPNCAYCKYQKCLKIGMDQVPVKDAVPRKQDLIQVELHDREIIKSEVILPRKSPTPKKKQTDEIDLSGRKMIDKKVELKRKRLSVACTIAEMEGKFVCPDCLISFDGVRPLFQHLKKPHGEDYHRYSHVNQYGEELDGDSESEEVVDEIDKFERATYHFS